MGVEVQSIVRVLDADRLLGWALRRGPWSPAAPQSAARDLGLLIVDGVVLRQIRIQNRRRDER